MTLDVYELCTPELQQRLRAAREFFRLQDEEQKMVSKAAGKKAADAGEGGKRGAEAASVEYAPYSFSDDLGSNNSGFYELTAVLTHKGK